MNSCVDECLTGYYEMSGVCKLCSYPCLSCSNSSLSCLSCADPYILHSNSCVSQCDSFHFNYNNSCISCVYPCRRCQSIDLCLSCQTNSEANNQTYLWESSCIEECPLGTYADDSTLKCIKCSYPCYTCSSSRICLSCASGYLNPLQNTCEMCPSTFYPN